MKHKPIPWAIALTGVLYYALLIYWQSDELSGSGQARDAAVFGLVLSVIYVAYCMLCFQKDLPPGLKDMPFVGRYGKLTGWLAFGVIAVWYVRPSAWGGYDEGVGFFLVGILLLGFAAAAILTCFMWSGDQSSRLYALSRFVDVYPTITKPERHVRFNEKMWTTTFVLIIYFAMTNVMLFGLSGQALDLFSGFRSIMAGASGTIMHLGIGPIVTGSIIMQLFAGAKIIRLDLSNSEDKAMYQGVQKLLVLIMIPIESIPQTYPASGSSTPTDWGGPTSSSSLSCSQAPTSCSCWMNSSASGASDPVSRCSLLRVSLSPPSSVRSPRSPPPPVHPTPSRTRPRERCR